MAYYHNNYHNITPTDLIESGKGNSNTCTVVLVILTDIYSCYIGS